MRKEFEKEMKKGCCIGLAVSCIALIFGCHTERNAPKLVEEQKATYSAVMTVDSIFENPDFMFLYDGDGEEWIFDDTEGLSAGDKVIVLMDSNGTDKPFDDLILNVEKVG